MRVLPSHPQRRPETETPIAPTGAAWPALVVGGASFAALGGALALPGALLPVIMDAFAAGPVEVGTMLAVQPVTYLIAVVASARAIGRIGLAWVLAASVGILALGIGAFGLVSHWVAGAVALLVAGLGLGLLEVAGNAFLVLASGPRPTNILNLAHLFFGLGALAAPALATRAVAAGYSWRLQFLIAGAFMALIAVAWRLVVVPEPRPAAPSGHGPPRGPTRLLAVLLGVYVGVETGIGSWLTEYMTAARGLPLAQAGTCLALYWLGLAVGRLVLGILPQRVREERLLLGLATFATVALVAGLAASDPGGARLGLALTGLGFSGIFPAAIALGGRYDPEATARMTRTLIGGAAVGNITIPWTMAVIVGRAGVGAGMGFYAAMTALMVALVARLPRPPQMARAACPRPSTAVSRTTLPAEESPS